LQRLHPQLPVKVPIRNGFRDALGLEALALGEVRDRPGDPGGANAREGKRVIYSSKVEYVILAVLRQQA